MYKKQIINEKYNEQITTKRQTDRYDKMLEVRKNI